MGSITSGVRDAESLQQPHSGGGENRQESRKQNGEQDVLGGIEPSDHHDHCRGADQRSKSGSPDLDHSALRHVTSALR